MSAFLGPIHSWLYGKIVFQNQLVNEIYNLAVEEGWDLTTYNEDRYGELPQGDLVDIVDENNIHGWLQDKVNLVENKLAYIVTMLTDENKDRMVDIEKRARVFGTQNAFGGTGISDAYVYLESVLLSGMPCDHVNQKIEEDESHITWKQMVNIHAKYWEHLGGNVAFYDQIRNGLIEGIVESSGISFHVDEDAFTIERKK